MTEVKPNAVSSLKSCCWSITINNPTEDDFVQWNILPTLSWVKEVKGQVEKGENGTPHIQGMVRTLSVRFSQVKRALPRAHIEAARNERALAAYVVKEATRAGAIPQYKVASQKDCQKKLLDLTLGRYLEEGGENSLAPFFNWLEQQELRQPQFPDFWIDAAVKCLIREGFYGIEFVMSNNQVRGGFKRYFKEIIIREYYGSSQDDSPPSPQERSPSQDRTQDDDRSPQSDLHDQHSVD